MKIKKIFLYALVCFQFSNIYAEDIFYNETGDRHLNPIAEFFATLAIPGAGLASLVATYQHSLDLSCPPKTPAGKLMQGGSTSSLNNILNFTGRTQGKISQISLRPSTGDQKESFQNTQDSFKAAEEHSSATSESLGNLHNMSTMAAAEAGNKHLETVSGFIDAISRLEHSIKTNCPKTCKSDAETACEKTCEPQTQNKQKCLSYCKKNEEQSCIQECTDHGSTCINDIGVAMEEYHALQFVKNKNQLTSLRAQLTEKGVTPPEKDYKYEAVTNIYEKCIKLKKELDKELDGIFEDCGLDTGTARTDTSKKIFFSNIFLEVADLTIPRAFSSEALKGIFGVSGAKNIQGLLPSTNSYMKQWSATPMGRMISFGAEAKANLSAAQQFQDDANELGERIKKLDEIITKFETKVGDTGVTLGAGTAKGKNINAISEDTSFVENFANSKFTISKRPLFSCVTRGNNNCREISNILSRPGALKQKKSFLNNLKIATTGSIGKSTLNKKTLRAIQRSAAQASKQREKFLKFQQKGNQFNKNNGIKRIDFQAKENQFLNGLNQAVKNDARKNRSKIISFIDNLSEKIWAENIGDNYDTVVEKIKKVIPKVLLRRKKHVQKNEVDQLGPLSNSENMGKNIDNTNKIEAEVDLSQEELDKLKMRRDALVEKDKSKNLFDILTDRYFKTFFKKELERLKYGVPAR
jgi:hypothetical protein